MMRKILSLLCAMALMLPLSVAFSEERPTISIGIPDHPLVEDWETNLQTLQIEETLGIDLTFQKLPYDANEYLQKIELMVMNGGEDLPDVLISTGFDLAALQVYGEMGMLIPLNEYMNDTPYLDESLAAMRVLPLSKEDYLMYLTCSDGNIYGFGYAFQSINNSLSPARVMVYEPWLETLGLTIPETTEEFRDMLIAFRDRDPNGNGIQDEIPLMGHKGTVNSNFMRFLMNPFVFAQENYLINNAGTIEFAAIQDGWKEGLKFVQSLFAEGLVSSLTLTQDQTQFTSLLAAEPESIGAIAMVSASVLPASDSRREEYIILKALEGPDGTRQYPQRPNIPSVRFVITRNCENVEAAIALGDYLSSIEMNNWSRYGIAGEHYAYLEIPQAGQYDSLGFQGDITITNNIWGISQNVLWEQLGPVVGDGSTITYRIAVNPTEGNYDHSTPIGRTIRNNLDYVVPEKGVYGLVFTAEEQEIITEYRSAINTYVEESFARFITGSGDIDAEWENYVEELYRMGLQEYLDALNSCWSRMHAK